MHPLAGAWSADWLWSLPLIAGTVVAHAAGLGLISQLASRILPKGARLRYFFVTFLGVVGTTAILVTCLHASEAVVWAAAYRLLGALPTMSEATLYSLSAVTTYGHEGFDLAPHWRLMGASYVIASQKPARQATEKKPSSLFVPRTATAFVQGRIRYSWPAT